MKKSFFLLLIVVTGFTLTAQPRLTGLTPEEILEFAPTIADKTIDELTIAERLTIAGAISVEKQKKSYVHHAGMASFILPGAGQFLTGNILPGVAHLAVETAIIGGTLTGLYFLLPEDLKQWDLTKEERKDIAHSYMTPDRIGEILPAMGVAVGGLVLSIINSILAANGAADSAQTNIDSGAVTFEPYVNVGNMLGLGFKLKWH